MATKEIELTERNTGRGETEPLRQDQVQMQIDEKRRGLEDRLKNRANDQSRERVGSRYFRIDPGYDKRVYVNDCNNWIKILVVFFFYYVFNFFNFWANFELGINMNETSTWVFVGMFSFSILIIIIMLISGSISNRKQRDVDAYLLAIAEKEKKI